MTTHTDPRHTAPAPTPRPGPGPSVELVGLPDPGQVRPTVPQEVVAHLTQMEAARQRQLDALPSNDLDTVTAAYRATVERILAEVRTALSRVSTGVYGVCAGCADDIPVERLQLRPWATMCARCAARDSS